MTRKARVENGFIQSLYSYLKTTNADEITVRTTHVKGCWHDNEFDAHAAGFEIYRFNNPEYEARHEFSECYKLIRR